MMELKSKSFILKDCFATSPVQTVSPRSKQSDTYIAEERKVDFFNGESREQVVKPYPITKEYVKSFAEATDYRSAGTRPLPARQNLGDIRDAQVMVQRDTMDVRTMIQDLKSKLSQLEKSVSKDTSAPAPAPVPAEGGVNNA